MEPLNNMSEIYKEMDTVVKTMEKQGSHVDQKIDTLGQLIAANEDFLSKYQSPAWVEKFRSLGARVAAIRSGDSGISKNIENVSKKLAAFAEDFKFPSEVLKLISARAVEKQVPLAEEGLGRIIKNSEFAAYQKFNFIPEEVPAEVTQILFALRQTSQEVRQSAVTAFEGPLTSLNMTKAEDVLRFAREFGPALTHIDISTIEFSKEQFQELVKLLPNLQTLTAKGCRMTNAHLEELKPLKKLQALDLSYNRAVGDEGAATIATLKSLKSLDLSLTSIGNGGASALAALELKNLELAYCQIGGAGVKAIAQIKTLETLNLMSTPTPVHEIATSPHLTNLRSLNLSNCALTDEDVVTLVNSNNVNNLHTLRLALNGSITEVGAEAIATSDKLKKLEILDLSSATMGDNGAKRLADSKMVTHLKELHLNECSIGEEGAESLANSEALKNLEVLNLNSNKIKEKGGEAIGRSTTLANLRKLMLNDCAVGDIGAVHIVLSKALRNLRLLDLGSNGITDMGAITLSNSETLKKLTLLSLSRNSIGDAGVEGLASSKEVKKLQWLNLMENNVSFTGAKAIAASPAFKRLRVLNLMWNGIGDEGVAAIARSRQLKQLEEISLENGSRPKERFTGQGVAVLARSRALKRLHTIECGEYYPAAQRKRLSQLTTAQWNQLFSNIVQLAKESGEIERGDKEWGKEHLFEVPERFERALAMVHESIAA